MTTTGSPPQLQARTTYRDVFAEPRFRVLFATRAVAITADALRISTFSVLIYATTASPLLSGVAFGAGFLPQAAGSTLLGSLADRLPPRTLICAGYLLDCVTALLLALTPLPIASSLVLVALVALLTPVFGGASTRLVAEWLTGDAYVLGRSLTNMASSTAQLAGLGLGGAAVSLLGARHALLCGAVLYAAVAAAVRLRLPRLPVPIRAPGAATSPVRASLAATAALLRARAPRRLLLAQWLPGACVAGGEGLLVAYAGVRHLPAGGYAVLMACLPIGMLAGDVVVGRLLRPPARERLVGPLIALMGVPLLFFAAEPGLALGAILLLLTGFGFAYGLGLQRPFLDALPSADAHGHAFGLLSSGTMTLQGLAPTLTGTLALAVGPGAALAAAGVGTLLTLVLVRR
ncbi:Predicted arabinose efflux permease, MFS family [Actinacidiphila yanglinensis]|uniref:Predicted arabinose efflux permease, MFS family n=1 Tax=Actinacidiphila yanglinensis TaxID=310779 RepID=A0A1H6CL09_9ACTN|nr:MFS transporter [Actinacidiphila yanglinensis]SEG73671.1 Predicted arabinose efflux permease, MFS family [Actinacidiphila yanglinensis]